jgi:hypothetical protein
MGELFLGGAVDPASHERTGDEIRLDTADFTTHGVIVGMTGSGKTGLGIVLIEEALRSGVPVLAIDPKGDLTNLCLTFPNLSPTEFRPWIDEGQAAAAGVTPDEFATQQADLWRNGLAGWGLGTDQITALRAATTTTVFTPGSRAGIPVNLVGSLQAPADLDDAEAVADEINGYVSGLLGLVGVNADPLSSREHILLSNLIDHCWRAGVALDLPTLVGMVPAPPIRKLGVFDVDQFFPAADRTTFALRLNGLLASPSFAAWADGDPLDVASMLRTPDGRPRCAVVTTAHLADEERQFVTSLVLSKVIAWMRRQSGTTDLRALVYLDEVAGYLPPTANPPTKPPIMTIMKTARAFGVGMVLSTQNPVDVDYKALSNAGTWMIGRLQTERDQARLLDGMRAAAGTVDIGEVAATISGLAKREFVLRRAGKDHPEVFTTRWAMSYLRGPMTRDQIASLTAASTAAAPIAATPAPAPTASTSPIAAPPAGAPAAAMPEPTTSPAAPAPVAPSLGPDETTLMPAVASGRPVRFVDPAAPWVGEVGGDPHGTRWAAALVARVHLRYDETRADDLVHDVEYEAVFHPLGATFDPSVALSVDHDDRDLRTEVPAGAVYRLPLAPIDTASYFTGAERALRDHLTRALTVEIPTNPELKLFGRPGESEEEFAGRCAARAEELADAAVAKLRDKYAKRVDSVQTRLAKAEDRVEVAEAAAADRRNQKLLSTATSVLGGLLGGRRSSGRVIGAAVGGVGGAAVGGSAAGRRVDSARNEVERLADELEDLEAELTAEVLDIEQTWRTAADARGTLTIGLEKSDVTVSDLVLAWLPVT